MSILSMRAVRAALSKGKRTSKELQGQGSVSVPVPLLGCEKRIILTECSGGQSLLETRAKGRC